MKYLITGNPNYGLAKALNFVFEAKFISRNLNSVDLSTNNGMDECVNMSLNFDCLIINIYTEEMNNYSQARLLHKVYTSWVSKKKKGRIVTIGSISDYQNGQEQTCMKYFSYGAEKSALRNLSESINRNRSSFSPDIACHYVSLGHMHTPYVDKLHPNEKKMNTSEVAETIKYIVENKNIIESIRLTRGQ